MDTLYHYCSNTTFTSIVKSRAVRLSSLSLTNDSMEGKLVTELLVDMAKNDGLDSSHIDRLKNSVGNLNKMLDGLGFCLSEERDLLSQWRGYADDANGVSAGFSKEYLEEFSDESKDKDVSGFTLQKVEYDVEKQKKLIEPTFVEIKNLIEKGAFKITGIRGLLDTRSEEEREKDDKEIRDIFNKYSMTTLMLFTKLFILKSGAFREEKEWRLISYFTNIGTDICDFYARDNAIVPYREYMLIKGKHQPITEVVLGPKNITPLNVVENLLHNNGYMNVKITRSEASYR